MRKIITTSTTNHVWLDPLQTSTQTCRYVWENLFPILSFLMLPAENITAVMTVTIPYIWGTSRSETIACIQQTYWQHNSDKHLQKTVYN